MIFNIIIAVDAKTYGIGHNGTIPWSHPEDMAWFKSTTMGHTVIMGWSTYESIGKPLSGRSNVVISANHTSDNTDVIMASGIDDAIAKAEAIGGIAFVIGGESIYEQFVKKGIIDAIYIDKIFNTTIYEYDTYADWLKPIEMQGNWRAMFLNNAYGKSPESNMYMVYNKLSISPTSMRVSEIQTSDSIYLNLLNDVIVNGTEKKTRSGATKSVFGRFLRFDASKSLPVLTTKKVYSKGCIHELLWFLKGDTNIKYLVDNNVRIWDDDAYRHYLDVVKEWNETISEEIPMEPLAKDEFINGVTDRSTITLKDHIYVFGDLGPVYGKQWRDWNGHDQIKTLIDTLKTDPDNRRLIVSAWNVGELDEMALPPCHYMSQWYTSPMSLDERAAYYSKTHAGADDMSELTETKLDDLGAPKRKLSVVWSQRSVDLCLGFPFNLLSYSTLLNMVAQVVNMAPCEVCCMLGDVHIYENHYDGAMEQLARNPYKFEPPTIELNKDITDIDDFTIDDINIVGYESYPTIKFPLSVGL